MKLWHLIAWPAAPAQLALVHERAQRENLDFGRVHLDWSAQGGLPRRSRVGGEFEGVVGLAQLARRSANACNISGRGVHQSWLHR